jgi:Holliday junction resolvase RusA-like endonuclease
VSGVRFDVPGEAKTAGSKKAFVVTPKGGGRPRAVVTDDAGEPGKRWRKQVALAARVAMSGEPLLPGALTLYANFYVKRPQDHYVANDRTRELKDRAPRYPTLRPDTTKMLRAVEDAITGVVYHDDSQVCDQHVSKRYVIDGFVGVKVAVVTND